MNQNVLLLLLLWWAIIRSAAVAAASSVIADDAVSAARRAAQSSTTTGGTVGRTATAVRDAVLYSGRRRRRHLQTTVVIPIDFDGGICTNEAVALDNCVLSSSSSNNYSLLEASQAWADCLLELLLESQRDSATISTSNSDGDDTDCDALSDRVCAPLTSCPALTPCTEEYTPYVVCLGKAAWVMATTQEERSATPPCEVSCQAPNVSASSGAGSSSSTSGSSMGATTVLLRVAGAVTAVGMAVLLYT